MLDAGIESRDGRGIIEAEGSEAHGMGRIKGGRDDDVVFWHREGVGLAECDFGSGAQGVEPIVRFRSNVNSDRFTCFRLDGRGRGSAINGEGQGSADNIGRGADAMLLDDWLRGRRL